MEMEGLEDLSGSCGAGSDTAAQLAIDAELHVTNRLQRLQRRLGGEGHTRLLEGVLQHPAAV